MAMSRQWFVRPRVIRRLHALRSATPRRRSSPRSGAKTQSCPGISLRRMEFMRTAAVISTSGKWWLRAARSSGWLLLRRTHSRNSAAARVEAAGYLRDGRKRLGFARFDCVVALKQFLGAHDDRDIYHLAVDLE